MRMMLLRRFLPEHSTIIPMYAAVTMIIRAETADSAAAMTAAVIAAVITAVITESKWLFIKMDSLILRFSAGGFFTFAEM